MAAGIGIDIVKVSRIRSAIQKGGKRFLERVFSPVEISYCKHKAQKFLSYAGRFAVKEAFIKAIGGTDAKVRYRDIEVKTLASGQPTLKLSSSLLKKFRITQNKIAVSLAHEKEFAVAVVVLL